MTRTIVVRRDLLKAGIGLTAGAAMGHLPFGLLRAREQSRPDQPGVTPRRLYIAADDHTDYMWSADETTYRQAFLEVLDYYLDLMDTHAANPPDYQPRWVCDGSLLLWEYEHNKSAAAFDRLMARVHDGHITVPYNTLVSVYGGMPAEAALRGLYYAGSLERRYNLRLTLALAMENQTLPYGLGALWAGSGARYSWRGICDCATRIDAKRRDHEVYWWTGPDGSRILLKWYSLTYTNMDLGGYAEAVSPPTAISHLDTKLNTTAYPYTIGGAFGRGWDYVLVAPDSSMVGNAIVHYNDDFMSAAQAGTTSNRRVIVSNEVDFFTDFEASYGAELPSVSCTFGNEWDLLCASMAEVSARVKRAVEKLRAAEAMAALVTLHNPGFMSTRAAARDQAWINLGMYWEHCWSAGPAVDTATRAAWQRRVATDIESFVNTLHDDAANALAAMVQTPGTAMRQTRGTAPARYMAFNSLGWARTDAADLPYSGAMPVHVIDIATGNEVPSQAVTANGIPYIRILASDVPAAGYKVYEVAPGIGQATFSAGPSTDTGTGVIQNEAYHVTLAHNGAITSLLDKGRNNREFTRNIGGYTMNDLGTGTGTLSVENAGLVSASLVATASGPLAHTTRVTLYRGMNRVDIHNEITQNFTDVHQWRFGFNIDSPDVWHEEIGAIIRGKLLADGGHYSPANARYDWLTLNHFADVSGAGNLGITLANADCCFMQLGNSTLTTLDTATPQLSPLVGGMTDGFGIPNQDGDTFFVQRFALQTHGAFDPAAAMRFALEHQNPLVVREINGSAIAPYPATSFSLLTISNPNILLWALKPAEDGSHAGIVTRVWNLSSSPASGMLTPAIPLRSARQLTHVETPITPILVTANAIDLSLTAQQMKTYGLDMLKATFVPQVER